MIDRATSYTRLCRAMRLERLLPCVIVGLGAGACADLTLTDPNRQTTDTFWQTQADALAGMTATYNGLQRIGTYGRWGVFAFDIRSDIGFSNSPWGELANFNKFAIANYDFEVNNHLWRHHYETIYRANQVIQKVPGISMEGGLRSRIVGEAKFVRALLYSNLANLYGNVPLQLDADDPSARPATVPEAQVWAQVERDLRDARAVLPVTYGAADVGRPTRGAADALLGKILLQQRKWAEARTALLAVVSAEAAAGYMLMPDYGDNFTVAGNNNRESVFEVQMSNFQPNLNQVGLNIGKFVGPCQIGFCDGTPTRWYFDQFFIDSTATVPRRHDPRADYTFFWNKPGEMVFGVPFTTRYGTASTAIFWKKWTTYWKNFQDFDEPVNYRVIRYADVLLMLAEAENEANATGGAAAAKPYVDRVRARVQLAPLGATALASQAAMRDAILRERLLEFGLEQSRWLDLRRHRLMDTQAEIDVLKSHDSEFNSFQLNKSELLPIPQSEINTNPNARQNPGY